MASQDNRSQAEFNPNPFESAGRQNEGIRWANDVSKAERHDSSESTESSGLEKTKSNQSALDNLTGIQSVKSAMHSAKEKFHLKNVRAGGVSSYFNPTSIHMHVKFKDDDSIGDTPDDRLREQALTWRARDNRKGRTSIAVPVSDDTKTAQYKKERAIFSVTQFIKNICKMLFTFPYYDMAFWSGWSYSIGSILFVIDGAWSVQSIVNAGSVGDHLTTYGAPLCFFIGALFYQVGATMAYFEAVNDGSFQGSAMRRFLEGNDEDSKKMLDDKVKNFVGHVVPHHRHKTEKQDELAAKTVDPEEGWKNKDRDSKRPNSVYPTGKAPAPRRGGVDFGETEEGNSSQYLTWRWYPSWHALKTYHAYEIGYIACSIQLFGATLYGITGVVDLPGILSGLADWQETAAFWVPQVVASVCFLTASILFMLESQEKWYRPEPGILGWWIGVWATIGSCGFLLCACFGLASFSHDWAELQADVSSMWGSACYLISALLQWYEGVNKRPIAELFSERGKLKSSQIHPV